METFTNSESDLQLLRYVLGLDSQGSPQYSVAIFYGTKAANTDSQVNHRYGSTGKPPERHSRRLESTGRHTAQQFARTLNPVTLWGFVSSKHLDVNL